jgi:hypothetical protein
MGGAYQNRYLIIGQASELAGKRVLAGNANSADTSFALRTSFAHL